MLIQSVDTSSQTITLLCIIVFCDRIIFSTLKTFLKRFAHGKVIETFKCDEYSTNREDNMTLRCIW